MKLIQLLLHFQNISAKFNLMASNFIYVHLEILIVYKMFFLHTKKWNLQQV